LFFTAYHFIILHKLTNTFLTTILLGPLIKLPFGKHKISNVQSKFIDNNDNLVKDQMTFIHDIKLNTIAPDTLFPEGEVLDAEKA